jgi:Zn-dependent protease with chaperone function
VFNRFKSKYWNQIKGFPFRINLVIFSITVLLAILFPVLRQSKASFYYAVALSFTLGMVCIAFVEYIASVPSNIKLWGKIKDAKLIYSFGLVEEISQITQKMGLRIKNDYRQLKYINDWFNAAIMTDGSIVVGSPVLDELTKEYREGIFGHELGHRKGKHHLKRFFLLLSTLPLFLYLIYLPFPIYINLLMLFAAARLITPLISWLFEYDADKIAAKCIGPENVINGLMKLATLAHIDINADTFTHPSISRRIKKLQEIRRK